MSTPGHTMESICMIAGDEEFVFTGDTLFLGDSGRPDLANKSNKDLTAETLASHLFDSLQKLKKLKDSCIILPTHGAGSACGKKISSALSSTMKEQKETNVSLIINDKDEFIKEVTNELPPPPEYFYYNV